MLTAKNVPYFCRDKLTDLRERHKKKLRDKSLSLYFGDPPGVRTQDPNIKSVVLYQLS